MSFFGNRRQPDPEPERPSTPPINQPPAQSLPPQPIGFETVLGASTTLQGDLVSHANVRIDGTFTGSLEIHGNVLVGETAKITADINAKNISIAGAVHGNVSGKKVQLLRTGRVWGDITASALSTEEGAFIDGKISMVSHEAVSAPAETTDTAPAETTDTAPAETTDTVPAETTDTAPGDLSDKDGNLPEDDAATLSEPDFLSAVDDVLAADDADAADNDGSDPRF